MKTKMVTTVESTLKFYLGMVKRPLGFIEFTISSKESIIGLPFVAHIISTNKTKDGIIRTKWVAYGWPHKLNKALIKQHPDTLVNIYKVGFTFISYKRFYTHEYENNTDNPFTDTSLDFVEVDYETSP